MRFDLDDVAQSVHDELERWSSQRLKALSTLGPYDERGWRHLTEFGLIAGEQAGMRAVDVAVGMLAAARGGLPGPVLEASLACAAGSAAAQAVIARGGFVTSVPPGPAGSVLVGWGAVSELVVDQGTGATLAEGPLPEAQTALPMGHGRITRPQGGEDPLRATRWLYGAALIVGLGFGSVHFAAEHVKARTQFGRPLSSFQAVQFRLAESILKLEGAKLMVLDAARRRDADDPHFQTAAALAWIYSSRIMHEVEKNVHQVCGAMGFTEEAGLVRLTYQSFWLRSSIGRADALRHVAQARHIEAGAVPPSTVLAGFSPQ